MKFAVEAGINFIDTANVYSLGKSETLLGQALKNLRLPREEIIVATKSSGIMDDTPNGRGQSRHHIFNQVDASLRRLQLDHIDLYQLHAFDPLTPFEESLSALNDVVRSGRVRYIGLCNMAAWQIMKSLGVSERQGFAKFHSVQAYYTVAGRDLEREVVPLLQDQKLGLMVWSPLAGGLLSGKYRAADDKGPAGARRTTFDFPPVDRDRAFKCVDAMRPLAQQRQVSVAQIALAWILSKPFVSSVIIGAKIDGATARQHRIVARCAHGGGNQAAGRGEPTAAGISRLDAGVPGPVSRHAAVQGVRLGPRLRLP